MLAYLELIVLPMVQSARIGDCGVLDSKTEVPGMLKKIEVLFDLNTYRITAEYMSSKRDIYPMERWRCRLAGTLEWFREVAGLP